MPPDFWNDPHNCRGGVFGWGAAFLSERWRGRTGRILYAPNLLVLFSAFGTILTIQYSCRFRVSDGEAFSLLLGGAGFIVATVVRSGWNTLELD